jgi:3-phosphoshikimate 1-carboxyvinyltransferase
MSTLRVIPGSPLRGTITLPGDKSISHRAALFASLAGGESRADNFLESGVTAAMLSCLTALDIEWTLENGRLRVNGRGLAGWQHPYGSLNCGNSATTLRLLAGAVAAAGIEAVLDGSEGLRRRPMGRIIEPLREMGVVIQAAPGDCAPLHIIARPSGEKLKSTTHVLAVASAQVKSCLMLAGLAADGVTRIVEPSRSRDHSERMLAAMGVPVQSGPAVDIHGWQVSLSPPPGALTPLNITIPGDFSAAAFLIVAGLITPGSDLLIPGVGLNPGRTGLLETLLEMGADIQVLNPREQAGEPVGDLRVRASLLRAGQISGQRVVDMIDEFPVFAAAAAYADGPSSVCDAQELRYKESDRIGALCAELARLSLQVEEAADGFTIHGQPALPGGASVDPHRDHRLAMALAVAGLAAQNPVEVQGAEIIHESFPGFVEQLTALGAKVELC